MLEQLRTALLKRLDRATAKLARLETPTSEWEDLNRQGNAFVRDGKFSEAEQCYRAALTTRPNDAKLLVNVGFALKEQKRLVEARVYLKRAIALGNDVPLSHETHYLFGLIAEEQGDLEEAITSFRVAFTLKPDFELACRDLCRVLSVTGKSDAAQRTIQVGLALNPQNADFHFYQANLFAGNEQFEQALLSYSTALDLGANYADIHSALGRVQYRLGNQTAAIASFKNAQEIDPDAGALAQYASGYHFLRYGDIENAIANFEMAITLRPDFHEAYSILLFTLNFNPLHSTSYEEVACRYAAILKDEVTDLVKIAKKSRSHEGRPLKVGFVSGDLKAHPVGLFLEGILQNIDPQRIFSIAYSNTPNEDQNTTRLRSLFYEWHSIRGLSDDTAAQMIRDHQIDVLVDLSGHTGENRLPIFTRRPAPVQVTWLGYFASTGLSEIDYILADRVSVPEHSTEFFSEKLWRLPDTRLCMTPPITSKKIDLSPPPCLSNGYVTFGSFQSRSKINPKVLMVWSQVLAATPGSRLRLQLPQMDIPARRAELLRQLEVAGISRDRVSLNSNVHWEEYLQAHQHVDILLDTFPYPGGTTTAEALWMGVPTVTLMGDTMLSRQGACMLKCVQLDDWIAQSEREFVEKAVAFANDLPALTRLRSELRVRAIDSPLFDTRRFAANLQDCFENMFQLAG